MNAQNNILPGVDTSAFAAKIACMKKMPALALLAFLALPQAVVCEELDDAAAEPATESKNPMIEMTTPHGTVTLELFPDVAPKHVERILKLTREGFYDGILFHRVVPDFVAQVGDPKTKNGLNQPGVGSGGSSYPNVPLEVKEGV
ncbi:MAG: peptidylprolyl isomerase, partial [Verrucomicrobiia bacterium]